MLDKRSVRPVAVLILATMIASVAGPALTVSASVTGTYFDHVVIVMMEDHGINNICARSPPPCLSTNGDPYMAGLANSYAIGSQYLGVSHFSQADYIALLGGDIYGCVGYPCQPSSHVNLVDRLETAGLTWKGYMEDQTLSSGCDSNSVEPYTSEHNPFVFFTDITNNPARCSHVVRANPTTCTVTDCALINDLDSGSAPNFMWLTPNNCDNMHGATGICSSSIAFGDNYLSSLVPNILNSQTFTSQRSALFVVYDEGNGYCPLNKSSEDCVYNVWAGPVAKTSFTTSNLYNHYSWTKTIETNWNLASLSTNDAAAIPMTEYFTSTSPSLSASFSLSPSAPVPGQSVTFTGTATGGVSPYTFSWNFGDGTSLNGNPVTHSFSTGGTFAVKLTVTDNVGHTAVSSQNVTLQNSDFKLSANPVLLTVQVGQNSQSAITITSLNGFQGTVSLVASSTPVGLTVSMEHPSAALNSGQSQNDNLKITATNTAPTGVYIATVKATSGQLTHSLNVTIRVPDFNLTANPTSLNISPGQSGTSQITFQSMNGFQGGISVQLTVAPPGPKATLNPNNPNLSANKTVTSTLTVQVPSNQAPGIYNVTLKATAGKLMHTLVIQVFIGQHSTTTTISCAPTSVLVNQGSTCTAMITDTSPGPTTPTGTVSFSETGPSGSFSSTTCILVSGSCSVTFTPTQAGTPTIAAVYGGDTSHSGSTSPPTSINTGTRTSATSLTCNSPVVVNQASSCTVTVTDTSSGTPSNPTGTITFNETGPQGSFNSSTCTLSSGSCSVSFTAATTGTATINAFYTGDPAHRGSLGTTSITIAPRTTSTGITCANPVVLDQAANCTVTISDSSPGRPLSPTGNVSFVSDSAGIFSSTNCLLTSSSPGTATCAVSYTPGSIGTHTISGFYSGDAIHLASNGTSTITVTQRSTSTSVACSPTGPGLVQTCTATIIDSSPGTISTPSGTVDFTTNSTGTFSSNTCTLYANVSPGDASCQVTYTPLVLGTHTITGSYSGDAIHAGSQGNTSIGAGKDSTQTTVTCTPSTVALDQTTNCTATVTDTSIAPTTPTGSVSFSTSGTGSFSGPSCTLVNLNSSSASCQVTYTPTSGPGTHNVSAAYNGDTTHNSSASTQAFGLGVTLRTTSTSLTCAPSSVVVNQATSCTATVTDSSGQGSTTPSGTVSITPGGSCTLLNGSCSVTVTPSQQGSLTISANYNGDSTHSTSTGNTVITVGPRSTSTTLSCTPNPAVNGTSVTCLVNVTDTAQGTVVTPTGLVNFATNSTGTFNQSSCNLSPSGTTGVASCSVTYAPLITGSHSITAGYTSDSSHSASTAQTTLTVAGSAPKQSYALVVSNDGRVSRIYQNGTLVFVGQPVTTALRSVAWRPDGSYALISGDFAVLLKYDGTNLTSIPTGISTGFNFWTVSWRPDGSYALVGGTSGLLFKYDGTKVTTITNPFSSTILSISWGPGNTALLVGKVGLVLTYDGTTIRSFSSGTSFDLQSAAWNPNGQYALVGGLNRTLLQFNGTSVSPINTSIVSPNNAIRSIAFNQAGTLALLSGDNGMVLTYDGSTLTKLATLTSSWLYGISWSPSGTAYIAGGSGTILTYSNGTLAKLTTTPTTTTQYRAISWKPQ